MAATVRCFLRCRGEERHDPIELLATECNYLGRTPLTKIRDVCCSRKQVSLDVDHAKRCVTVRQLGTNAAGLNGFALEPNKSYTAHHGDVVEVIHGKYLYEVCFESSAPKMPAVVKEEGRPKRIRTETASDTAGTSPMAEQKPKRTRAANGDATTVSTSSEPPVRTLTRSAEKKKIAAGVSTAAGPAESAGAVGLPQAEDCWDSVGGGKLLIFTAKGVQPSSRIAAYDIDGTIIKTKSGNVFPKDADDWQLAFAEVPGKLKQHSRNGYKIVFFTNQAGIASGRTDVRAWKQKLERIVQKLAVPVQVFVATGPSIYRKPKTGMWDTLKSLRNGGVRIERQSSWFVGDAAGRPATSKRRRKDHSLADRLFASNVDVPFQTPEEHFQGVPREAYNPPEFIPALAMKEAANKIELPPADGEPQVIVMVGAPGSGKSHVARTLLEPRGFVVINQDTLKTWQKCVAMLESTLAQKSSAVVDNTNMDIETRIRYINVARKFGVNCTCYMMCTSLAQSRHNIAFRELIDPGHSIIPERLLIGMRNKYKEPQTSEGFAKIVRVHCTPQFANKQHELLYRMYLLEK